MDIDGALHTDVYARVGADLVGHELVASSAHDFTWQHDRARADIAQFTSGDEIRNSVSGVCSSGVWNDGVESAGVDASARRVRLVWHTSVDRRTGVADVFRVACAVVADPARR